MRWLIIILLGLSPQIHAQCKTYRLTSKGDTLNCTDINNKKQGKWTLHLDEVRGEPGYEEEGVFTNNQREGKWKRYSLMGDLLAVENYRWGFKDGLQQYYLMGELEHEESWRAIDPKKKFDTIDVPDLFDPNKVTKKVIKVEGYNQKNGVWNYYKPGYAVVLHTETYLFDSLLPPTLNKPKLVQDAAVQDTTTKGIPTKVIPKQVADFEKNNRKKKQAKIRDGNTGG